MPLELVRPESKILIDTLDLLKIFGLLSKMKITKLKR